MRKLLNKLSVLICGCLIAVCALSTFASNKDVLSTPTRDVELIEQNVDYQALFEEFEDVELIYDEENQYISFSGIQTISSNELEELDLVSVTNDASDELDVKYSFEYYEETNLFLLNIKIVNVDGGEILDSVPGMPFIDENGETDIAFVLDDEVVLLSEMEENPLFENCGWFSNAWKKFKKAAVAIVAVAVVVAVVVVAAPAVVAAIPTVTTVALAGGGTAAVLTGGGAAAAMTSASVAAATTLPTIAAVTATTLAVAAVDAGIEAKNERNDDASKSEEVKKQIDDLLEDSEEGRETSGKTGQYLKKGGFDQANKDYDSLNPNDSKEIQTEYGKGRTGTLGDGSKVNVRPGSSYGEPTLEIQLPNGKRIKIRYGK